MKAYINKETKSLAVYTNFIPSDISNLIELTEPQYREYQEKISSGYNATFSFDNNIVNISYELDLKPEYIKELNQIKQWFKDNDWKVNKVVIGEWDKSDGRWLEYLKERTIKRARQDELNTLLNN